MTRIESITFRDFKGVNGTTRVGALNLIVGGNGTGKTAHLLGPQFAVEGKTPLGGRLEDSYALGSVTGCGVGLRLSDGHEFERRLDVDARKRTLAMSISIAGKDNLKVKDAEALLKDRCGDFAPMWDIEAFLGLSIDRQRQFILALCSQAGDAAALADPAYLSARCAVEFLRADPNCGGAALDSIAHQKYAALCDNLTLEQMREVVAVASETRLSKTRRDAAKRAINAIHAAFTGGLADAILAGINRANELVKEHKSAETRARETARGLSAKVAELNAVAGDVAEMRATLERHRAEERSVIEQIGRAQGAESARQSLADRLAELDAAIQASQDAVRTIEAAGGVGGDAEAARALLSSLERRDAELNVAINEASANHAAAKARSEAVNGDTVDRLRHDHANAQQAVIGLESLPVKDESESLTAEADALAKSELPGDLEVRRLGTALANAEGEEVAAAQSLRKAQSLFAEADGAAKRARAAGPNPWREAADLWQQIDGWIEAGERPEQWSQLGGIITRNADQSPDITALERAADQYRADHEAAKEQHRNALEARMKVEGELRRARDIADQEREGRRVKVAALRDQASASKREYSDWSARLQSAIERRDSLCVSLAQAEEAVKSDVTESIETAWVAIRCLTAEQIEVHEQIKKVSDGLTKRTAIESANAAITKHQDEREKVKAELAAIWAGESLTDLTARRDAVQAAITEQQNVIEAKQQYESLRNAMQDAIREAEEAAVDHDVCGCMVDALKEMREAIMEQLVRPVVSRMQRFLDVAMPGRRAFCDLTNALNRDDFALGWKAADSVKIKLQTMSGGERVIFCAALGYALVTLADPPLKLLLIEAAEVDADNFRSLIDGCESIAGEMSNVMVATCAIGAPDELPGWTVIHAHRGHEGGNGSAKMLEVARA